MARSIHCLHCGVALNLPPQAEGRRVRCPKCNGRFQVCTLGDAPKPAAPVAPGPDPDSTFELTRKASSVEMPVMPTAAGDLRETFELPMMTEADVPFASAAAPAGDRSTADAAVLFDDKPVAPRRKVGAEARAQARRCPTCGGVVPVGMSICQTCGLDLESGMRVGLDDDLTPPPPPRPSTPIPIAVLGGLAVAASLALAAFAIVQWQQGQAGAVYFVPVAAFGVYASVQFLRGRSVKLLLIAMTLGALIDVAGLIALPIYNAQAATEVIHRTDLGEDPDAVDEMIKPVAERLDMNRITTGIGLLVGYGVVSFYLLSPQVQRYYRKAHRA